MQIPRMQGMSLPQASIPVWPAASSMQPSSMQPFAMPPLPPQPPANSFYSTAPRSAFDAAAFASPSASICSTCAPTSSVSFTGPLDCPPALVGAPAATTPPLPSAIITPPRPTVSLPDPLSSRTPFAALAHAPAAAPAPALTASDELAMFAMRCHLDSCSSILDENTEICSSIRSPLRCNSRTGKIEAIMKPAAHMAFDDGRLELPLEPGLSKGDVSFSTQMVRRAVSFIFNDPQDDENPRRSPLVERDLHSPHMAIAA